MQYAIYDTKDHSWIGNKQGPIIYTSKIIAQVASQVFEHRITGTDLGGRLKVKPVHNGDQFKFKDQITPKRSGIDSLRRIEGGR